MKKSIAALAAFALGGLAFGVEPGMKEIGVRLCAVPAFADAFPIESLGASLFVERPIGKGFTLDARVGIALIEGGYTGILLDAGLGRPIPLGGRFVLVPELLLTQGLLTFGFGSGDYWLSALKALGALRWESGGGWALELGIGAAGGCLVELYKGFGRTWSDIDPYVELGAGLRW